MNFLFWNLKNRDLDDHLVDIKNAHDIDIFILAEHQDQKSKTVNKFASHGYNTFVVPKIACKKITMYYFTPSLIFSPGPESDYYTLKRIKSPNSIQFILAMVHLPSKMYKNEQDLKVESSYLKNDIETLEKKTGVDATIVVGDFNMNPYEGGMISAKSLHSLPCKRVASQSERTISGRQYSMMYNPMWNLFGDAFGSPGTYYYNSGHHEDTFWNMYDQVIIRPALINRFSIESLDIITEIAGKSLVSPKGIPSVSDHLPIKFSVEFEKEV